MVNDVYLHKAQISKQGRGQFVGGCEGVELAPRNPPSRRPAPTVSRRNLLPHRCVHAPAPRLFETR